MFLVVDTDSLDRLAESIGGHLKLAEIIQEFLHNLDPRARALESALAVLDHDSGDSDLPGSAASCAHSLASAAFTVYAMRLGKLANELEKCLTARSFPQPQNAGAPGQIERVAAELQSVLEPTRQALRDWCAKTD